MAHAHTQLRVRSSMVNMQMSRLQEMVAQEVKPHVEEVHKLRRDQGEANDHISKLKQEIAELSRRGSDLTLKVCA